MSLLETVDKVFEIGQVGDFAFLKDDSHIAIRLTVSEDGIAVLPISNDSDSPRRWNWDGNHESPTLTPSIFHHGKPEWHGFLREGKLILA